MSKRLFIYVFGPKTVFEDYKNDKDCEWLKIGQTSSDDSKKNKWDVAKNRIKGESHTGIPVTCRIFDVFEYPHMTGKIDKKIRDILTEEVYSLDSSKKSNKKLDDPYEIKAGEEFVYYVTRKQVWCAIAKFERDYIRSSYGKDGFDELMKCVTLNSIDPYEANRNEESPDISYLDNTFWNDLKMSLPEDIRSHFYHHERKPYGNVHSKNSDYKYILIYSVRSETASVFIETYKGETKRSNLQSWIDKANDNVISNLTVKQGQKNKKKWYCGPTRTLDTTREELLMWYVETIQLMYNYFEGKVDDDGSAPLWTGSDAHLDDK